MFPVAQTGLTATLFLAALGLTIGFLLLRSQRDFRRRVGAQAEGYRVESQARPRQRHHVNSPEDLVEWEARMREEAREWSARLDTKMGLLQQLIAEADRAAARLEAALALAERAAPQQPGAEPAAPQVDTRLEAPDWSGQVASQAEALKLAGGPGRTSLGREQTATETSTAASEEPPPGLRYQEIYTLADYGFEAAEISRRVGTPVGEVELILGLRGKR